MRMAAIYSECFFSQKIQEEDARNANSIQNNNHVVEGWKWQAAISKPFKGRVPVRMPEKSSRKREIETT